MKFGNYQSLLSQNVSLGKGTYGNVYLGFQNANPNNKVAIKDIIIENKQKEKQIKNQIQIMKKINSQYTVKIFDEKIVEMGLKKQLHYLIVMELMDGSLKNLFQQKGKLTEQQAIKWTWKIAQSYKALYDANIIHRDLKPDNVLYKKVNNQLIFKLSDFGTARDINLQGIKNMSIKKGTPYYLSPQQNSKLKSTYTNKADVYALGVIFFQFLNGFNNGLFDSQVVDFYDRSFDNKMFEKISKKLQLSPICQQFLRKCLEFEQINRYSWNDIFSHKIFENAGLISSQECLQLRKKYPIEIDLIKKYPLNIQQLLKGVKKVKITPNHDLPAFKMGSIKIDEKNKNIYSNQSTIGLISIQELPIKDASFYFTIKVMKAVDNKIYIGMCYSNTLKQDKQDNVASSRVGFEISGKRLSLFHSDYKKSQSSDKIQKFPSQLMFVVNKQKNKIYIIYNDKVQVETSLTEQMLNQKSECYANIFLFKSCEIQFI